MEEGGRRLGVSAVVYLSAGAALTRGFHFPWSERGRDCLHQDIPVIFGRQTVSIAGVSSAGHCTAFTGSSRKRCHAPCSGLETDHTHAAGHCIHSPYTCPDNLRLQSDQRGCIHAQSAAAHLQRLRQSASAGSSRVVPVPFATASKKAAERGSSACLVSVPAVRGGHRIGARASDALAVCPSSSASLRSLTSKIFRTESSRRRAGKITWQPQSLLRFCDPLIST